MTKIKFRIAAIPVILAALVFSGCEEAATEKMKQVARDAASNAAREVREEARSKTEELQKKLDEAQAKIGRLEIDQSDRQQTEKKAWRYAKFFVYLVGSLTCLKLFGKPIGRVSAALLIRLLPLDPRQILPQESYENRTE